jgi:multicomponent Na+:H+ antiporter subunit G
MTLLRDGAASILLTAGCLFYVAGTVGLLRFPDARSRLHALTKADNLGLGLVLAGLAVHLWSPAVTAKLLLTWGLALFAAATSSQLLARAVGRTGGTGREAS